VLNIGSDRIGGFAKVGDGLGFQLCSEQTVSCATGVQGTSEPWGRFNQKSRSCRRIRQSRAFYANRAKPHKHRRLSIALIWRVGT